VTLKNLDKAPFPWFGGKSQAAPTVWALLGDVAHYAEPFAGSLAVLLGRPHPCNRPYLSETVNDIDGMLVNFWRSVQWYPDETAAAASWPVTEADKQARQVALLRWREEHVARLAGDAAWCDPLMAGWWAWAVSCQIGAFAGDGPWVADPETGRLVKQSRPGVRNNLPHLASNGSGVNHAGTREPGVRNNRPHLTGNGRGVTHPGTREPGVTRNLPHLGNDGRGVNHAGTREPGVKRDRPHLTSNGQGVNRPGTREPGVLDPITPDHGESALDDWGSTYHDRTMPELIRWFRHLCARLRHVRVLNGNWARTCTTGALQTLPVRSGKGYAGIFLDPPYGNVGRSPGIYAHDTLTVASDVLDWCRKNGDNPKYRVVLAGYDGEHEPLEAEGWTVHEWFTAGWLRGGMGNVGGGGDHQQHRERLWASPHCLTPVSDEPGTLFR